MTIQKILESIKKGDIPLSFIYKDGKKCILIVFDQNQYIDSEAILRTIENKFNPGIIYFNKDSREEVYSFRKETIDECLSDFLFWFELNKNRYKGITYYTD